LEEFIALAQETFDPELWTEDDLPLMGRAKQKRFREASPMIQPSGEDLELAEHSSRSPHPE
jgi:hypothetical protein